MQVNLYYTEDDIHKVHKTLVSIQNCVGYLREECGMIRPEILIEAREATAARCNYAEIVDLDITRYYFVQEKVMVRDGLVRFKMEIDPLMTYESYILATECTVERNSEQADSYLLDDQYKIDTYRKFVTYDFETGFDRSDDTFVLLTVGPGGAYGP